MSIRICIPGIHISCFHIFGGKVEVRWDCFLQRLFLLVSIASVTLTVVMAYVGMAYVGMAYVGMAYVGMAYVLMAYIVMAYAVTAYVVLAYVVLAYVAIVHVIMAYAVTASVRMAYVVMALCSYGLCGYTGRNGSRRQLAGGVCWGCSGGAQRPCGGPSTPNPTHISRKILVFKNWRIFPMSCGYVVVLPDVAQVRFWRPKGPHSEKKTCHLAQKTVSWSVLDRVGGSRPETRTETHCNGPYKQDPIVGITHR